MFYNINVNTRYIQYKVIYETIHGAGIYHFNIIAIVGDGAQANSRFQERHFVNEIKYIKGI